MPNHLSGSTSPYLLQHANNPVDWYPWGEEALGRAREEDKPIFLSIGYAACHWCHVMAHESFEDAATAAFMNDHFVNIKVDREERPDLDSIYMQATTAMTGAGGWPMSVFLTPDLKPFYAGTYFPKTERYNMPSFMGLLTGLARAWQEQREEIIRVGGQVAAHLQNALRAAKQAEELKAEHLDRIAKALIEGYDWGYGGWGAAPKFPQAMTIEFLLLREAGARKTDAKELEAALHALRAMARGGMYDVVGGGFARYSTDNFWRVPHFEKMLYDNALLSRAYLHAWQITGDDFFRRITEEILDFVSREMTHPEGGFYSSLDADSEGEEGKFYAWTLEEIESALGVEAEFFKSAYGISPAGNWEGRTVLQRALDDRSLAARYSMPVEDIPARLAGSHSKLLEARSARVRPGTDDKVLTGWNGLMLAAFAEASRALGSRTYLDMATRNANFLLQFLRDKKGLHRTWRDGRASSEVFLDDYASFILGLLELYQADFDARWYSTAVELTDEMIERFTDEAGGGFFDTPRDGERLLFRPKDTQDNATPSGNSLACEVLLKMWAFSGEGKYLKIAEQVLEGISDLALKYPIAYAHWLWAAEFAKGPVQEIAIIGEAEAPLFGKMLEGIRKQYRPLAILAAAPLPLPEGSPPLLKDRMQVEGRVTAYVCENFVCQLPVTTREALEIQLNKTP